ncbi:MAG: hypothetical protein COB37_03080 [Kordiimonadales bacterium]|nr:MAG: hypothetical protein COB37_03080 [Kordiimonadales bacterium]
MSELIIMSVPQSNFARSVRMLAAEKGVPCTLQPDAPHSDPVKAISPFGKVPVMKHGDVEIFETSAIARYIEAAFDGPKFFPEDPATAAKVEEWVSLHATQLDKTMIRQYAFAYIFPGTDDGSPNQDVIKGCIDAVKMQLEYIDGAVGDGYLVGDEFTYADMALYPTLAYMRNFPESGAIVKACANLTAYMDKIDARESAHSTKPPKKA